MCTVEVCEVHCYVTPIYNLGKCRLMEEFFHAFAILISWKEIQIFGFPCCSTRKDLSFDESITNAGYIYIYIIKFLGFYVVIFVKAFPSIYVSITNVGLISTKVRWFQHFSTSQNSISNFKKIKFLDFHALVLVKTFPLIYKLLM